MSTVNMKPVKDLWMGYRDAESYKVRSKKDIFNRIFIRTPELDRLCEEDVYFLIGEKGTGKTAYAVYLSNMEYRGIVASLRYIRETEYSKFVTLKQEKHLSLSEYTDIWKVIIYLLLAQQIKEKREQEQGVFNRFWNKFDKLSRAIDEYYQNAFSPEMIYAIQFAENAEIAAELLAKSLKAGISATRSFSESHYQIALRYIQRQFEDAFRTLKLSYSYLLFIDGIDIRPGNIEYEEYLSCVKGLANAVWSINSDFFANIKDSKGRLRVVLLMRPDIFNSLGLQNQNSKIRDNSVVLNWITTYTEYQRSPLFAVADRLLSAQQDAGVNLPPGATWNYYFPYNAPNVHSPQAFPSSFIQFMRFSLYRPRDILTIMAIQQENFLEEGRKETEVFGLDDFTKPSFTRKYSDYILGEVKDHLLFYYTPEEYELFVKFFQFLNGKSRFTYQEYLESYGAFVNFITRNHIDMPAFCTTPDNFLQFLYDLNVISYIVDTDEEPFFGWCYRERTPSNIAPKVRTGVRYEVHYGLMKALDLGKRFSPHA